MTALIETKSTRGLPQFYLLPSRENVQEETLLDGLPRIDSVEWPLEELRAIYRALRFERRRDDSRRDRESRLLHFAEDEGIFIGFNFLKLKNGSYGKYDFDSARRWFGFAKKIFQTTDPWVWWEGVRPFIQEDHVVGPSDNPSLVYKPRMVKRVFKNGRTDTYTMWPIVRVNAEVPYFEFSDPNTFYFFVAMNYIDGKSTGDDVIKKLVDDDMFAPHILARSLPVLSFIAENTFLRRPTEFENFIFHVAAHIGGKEGFAAAGALLRDFINLYTPYLQNEADPMFTQTEREIIRKTEQRLHREYHDWCYQNRPEVIPAEVRAQGRSLVDGQGGVRSLYDFFELVYDGIGARAQFEEVLPAEATEPIRWIFEHAPHTGKMEAGLIPVMADILGVSKDIDIKWLTNIMQLLWTAILAMDDTIDQDADRLGQPALYRQEGMADGIQQPLLTILTVISRAITRTGIDGTLNEHLSRMLNRLNRGDMRNRKLRWETDFSLFEDNMIDIMQVLAWFPRYIAQRSPEMKQAGESLAQYMENLGCLILIKNDLDDLEAWSHPHGHDIGRRVNTYMQAFYHCPEIPGEIREAFRMFCDDASIQRKRQTFQPLNEQDEEKITIALAIGRKYKPEVVRYMRLRVLGYQEEAHRLLEEIFHTHLPVYDERNQDYHKLLQTMVDEIVGKILK